MIVRGVGIRNAAVHGILVRENRHDIVIERCFITFWGRIGGPITYGNLEGGYDSGIYCEAGTGNITIQRNLIEDPRGASKDWETGQSNGPQGITIFQSKGGNVIRYNDIVSTEDHGFNDAIGGGRRFVFHNTVLQPGGVFNAFTSHVNPNCVTRNNIFDVPGRLATNHMTRTARRGSCIETKGQMQTEKQDRGLSFALRGSCGIVLGSSLATTFHRSP